MDEETRALLADMNTRLHNLQATLEELRPLIEKAAEIGSVFESFGQSMGYGASGTASPASVHMVGQGTSHTVEP